jgi:tripartite ATP-independent transporter DctP family solute receptor
VAAAVSLACPAIASPRLISVVFNAAQQSPQQLGLDQLQRNVAESGSNRIVFDARGGGTLGSEAAILAATRSGAVDVAVLSAAPVSAAVPELGVLDIPFLFRDAKHAKAITEGPVGAAIAAKFADKGLVLLAIGKQGFRNITNSKRPIQSPSDLNGLKIRVVPNDVYQMTFKALGAEVVPLDFPLVYAGLKDGRIDGQENPIATIGSSRFQEVQKYLSLTSHFFAGVVFVANRKMFEQLDPVDQQLLVAAAKDGAAATWRDGDQSDAKWLDELRKGGMEITEKIDRKPFLDAVKPLEPEFEKRFGKDLLAAIRSTP